MSEPMAFDIKAIRDECYAAGYQVGTEVPS